MNKNDIYNHDKWCNKLYSIFYNLNHKKKQQFHHNEYHQTIGINWNYSSLLQPIQIIDHLFNYFHYELRQSLLFYILPFTIYQ